jgi:hypothetical protein
MLGGTDANWTACVQKTIDLSPDSDHLPDGCRSTRRSAQSAGRCEQRQPGASGPPNAAGSEASRRSNAGYIIGSAYTAVKTLRRSSSIGIALAGRRHGGGRRRLVRPRQRRAHAESDTFRHRDAVQSGRIARAGTAAVARGHPVRAPAKPDRSCRRFQSKYGVDLARFKDPLSGSQTRATDDEAARDPQPRDYCG